MGERQSVSLFVFVLLVRAHPNQGRCGSLYGRVSSVEYPLRHAGLLRLADIIKSTWRRWEKSWRKGLTEQKKGETRHPRAGRRSLLTRLKKRQHLGRDHGTQTVFFNYTSEHGEHNSPPQSKRPCEPHPVASRDSDHAQTFNRKMRLLTRTLSQSLAN